MTDMKALTAFAFAAASLACPFAAHSQQTRMLTADKHNEYGLVYSLPVTSVRFEITARQTVNHAGPYYQYAKKFIGTDRVIKEDSEQWEILSVKAVPFGTADTEKQYLMQLKPGAVTSICVADDGMLLAINSEADAPASSPLPADAQLEAEVGIRDYLQYVNEDFLASKSSAKQAQMLSESLMEVRDARVSLTRGTAETMPTDGRQLELMLNSLAHQEAAMTAAFKGTSETRTITRSFSFTPEKEGRQILFRMSDFAGFVDTNDYSGEPVYINVSVTREPELPVDAKGEEKKLPKDAVMYIIPGAARLTLSLAGKTLWSDEVECSQFGVPFGLQPSLFSDKKARSFAIFNPSNGALMQIGELNAE